MNVLIFGATGGVGRQLVAQALGQRHSVTAFTHTPANMDAEHPKLQIIQGDVLNLASVERAVQGQDTVLCVLGAGLKGTVRAEGTQSIIWAMEGAGVRRLVCQTTLGVGESWSNLNFFWKHVMFGLVLRPAFADHVQQEAHVEQSTLDWTVVRPGALTTGAQTGVYRHGFRATDETKLKISRADVADFMLRQLADDIYFRQTPGLSY